MKKEFKRKRQPFKLDLNKAPICPACKKPMTNAIDTITKKISQYLWECHCDLFKGKRLSRG